MKPSRYLALGLLLLFGTGVVAHADQASPPVPADQIIEQLPVLGDGDMLLVPVEVAGQARVFVLDTGASFTVLDQSLLKTHVKRTVKGWVRDSDSFEFRLYDPPPMRIGRLPLPAGLEVCGSDLTKWREITGLEIFGLIGLDILRSYVVQINPDDKRVYFLRSVPKGAGSPVLLNMDRGMPFVKVRISGLEERQLFLVDTGCCGSPTSGDLQTELVERLLSRREATRRGRARAIGFSGRIESQRTIQVGTMSLGNTTVTAPMLDSGQRNLLGLHFLSRFVATFDFPKADLYLRKSQRFNRPDLVDLSGLHILRRAGQTIVDSVDAGSLGEAGGIHAKDHIIRVDGKSVDEFQLFGLRSLLRTEGRKVVLGMRRGEREFTTTLSLRDYQTTSKEVGQPKK